MEDNVFFLAVEAHVKWKIRLQNHLDGTSTETLDPEVICQDNQCTLGQWIYGNGKKYGSLPTYEELRTTHANFHRCAADIIRKSDDGDKKTARNLFEGPYVHLSRAITKHLVKMNAAVRELEQG